MPGERDVAGRQTGEPTVPEGIAAPVAYLGVSTAQASFVAPP